MKLLRRFDQLIKIYSMSKINLTIYLKAAIWDFLLLVLGFFDCYEIKVKKRVLYNVTKHQPVLQVEPVQKTQIFRKSHILSE